MFQPQHCGLLFTSEHVQRVRKNKKRAPLREAWSLLHTLTPDDTLAHLQLAGLRYRLEDDADAWPGDVAWFEAAVASLPGDDAGRAAQMLVIAQCIEMLRDHPVMTPATLSHLLDWYAGQVQALKSPDDGALVDGLWMAALQAAYAVVFEDTNHMQAAVAIFRETIDREVHPEGYLPRVVEQKDAASLERQLSGVHALVLLAEIATHAGDDLWAYHNRGVSIMTAAIYPLYYYFYPEKWPWQQGDPLAPETVTAAFRARAGLLEILNGHCERPLKAVQMILDDCRPVVDVISGGVPTLVHGIPERRGLLG